MQINAGQLGPLVERLQLPQIVPQAVDSAIAEIINPVVERSVTIACMTAQELILKVALAILLMSLRGIFCTCQHMFLQMS